MDEEKLVKQAQAVYETVCKAMESKGWRYTRHDEELAITCNFRGDDLGMEMILRVNPKAQVVSLLSPMPFKIAENKRMDAALAVNIANYGLINGSFDYDLSDGEIRYRVVSSYRDSLLAESVFQYMVVIAASTVDDYNDKFLAISTGIMTAEQFLKWEQERNAN